jgi:hypothetical protein
MGVSWAWRGVSSAIKALANGDYTAEFAEGTERNRKNCELRVERETARRGQRRASSYVVLPRSIQGL